MACARIERERERIDEVGRVPRPSFPFFYSYFYDKPYLFLKLSSKITLDYGFSIFRYCSTFISTVSLNENELTSASSLSFLPPTFLKYSIQWILTRDSYYFLKRQSKRNKNYDVHGRSGACDSVVVWPRLAITYIGGRRIACRASATTSSDKPAFNRPFSSIENRNRRLASVAELCCAPLRGRCNLLLSREFHACYPPFNLPPIGGRDGSGTMVFFRAARSFIPSFFLPNFKINDNQRFFKLSFYSFVFNCFFEKHNIRLDISVKILSLQILTDIHRLSLVSFTVVLFKNKIYSRS